MDVESTDDKLMVLKYVTSYVAKWKDGISEEGITSTITLGYFLLYTFKNILLATDPYLLGLFSRNVVGSQAAFSFVVDSHPGAPQMAMTMASTKVAWSSSKSKRLICLPFTASLCPFYILPCFTFCNTYLAALAINVMLDFIYRYLYCRFVPPKFTSSVPVLIVRYCQRTDAAKDMSLIQYLRRYFSRQYSNYVYI